MSRHPKENNSTAPSSGQPEPHTVERHRFQTLAQARSLALKLSQLCPDPERVKTGLSELMINAVEHGNLEISYQEKGQLLEHGTWEEETMQRLALPRYRDRFAEVVVSRSEREIRFLIQDMGSGFDWRPFLEIDPQRILHNHGRGIAWAASLSFDRLEFYEPGSAVEGVVILTE
ncbi:MAG: ATP-binding protein [Magnetococcales bacterium]|nr:ATP-binding protein [Magnetococcales bacterium]